MRLNLTTPVLALEAGQVLTLDDAQGTSILARSGTVWVTEEGDRADHIVAAGDVLVVASPGRTVVQALEPAWISLGEGPRAANDSPWAPIRPAPDHIDEVRSRMRAHMRGLI
jgi:hypothetical protein